MSKKLLLTFFTLILGVGLWVMYSTPVFGDYASEFEVYSYSPSSNSIISKESSLTYKGLFFKCGESVVVNTDFDIEGFLEDFNANIVFTEKTQTGESLYFYSPKIKYAKKVKNRVINGQIHVTNGYIKIGTPIIFGSF